MIGSDNYYTVYVLGDGAGTSVAVVEETLPTVVPAPDQFTATLYNGWQGNALTTATVAGATIGTVPYGSATVASYVTPLALTDAATTVTFTATATPFTFNVHTARARLDLSFGRDRNFRSDGAQRFGWHDHAFQFLAGATTRSSRAATICMQSRADAVIRLSR